MDEELNGTPTLSDEDLSTEMGTSTPTPMERPADGTDGDATDGTDGDASDGDATDGTDGDASDADGTDGTDESDTTDQ
jgi:hypothetical protein